MNFYGLLVLIIISFNLNAMELGKSIIAPSELSNYSLRYSKQGLVLDNGINKYLIKKYNLNHILKEISNKKHFNSFLRDNYIVIEKISDGEYYAKGYVRGKGGGVILANCARYGVIISGSILVSLHTFLAFIILMFNSEDLEASLFYSVGFFITGIGLIYAINELQYQAYTYAKNIINNPDELLYIYERKIK